MKPFTPSGVLLISYSISKSSFTSSINSPHCHSYCSPVWRFVHPMLRPSERDSDGISFLSSRQSYQYRVQYDVFISSGEVPVYCLPFWKVLGQHSPLTAADQDIYYGLKDTSEEIFYDNDNHFQRTICLYKTIDPRSDVSDRKKIYAC